MEIKEGTNSFPYDHRRCHEDHRAYSSTSKKQTKKRGAAVSVLPPVRGGVKGRIFASLAHNVKKLMVIPKALCFSYISCCCTTSAVAAATFAVDDFGDVLV